MGLIASLKSWADLEILTAADLNANFAEVRNTVNAWAAFKDQAQAFTQPQTFSQGASVANGLTVTSGGAAVTGNSTVAGTLGVTGALTAGAGVAVTGAVTATGAVTGAAFTGAATGLTAIPTSQLTTEALPAGIVNATNIPASRITAGTTQGAITAPGVASSVGFTMTGGNAVQTPRTATISASTHTIDCSTGNWFERLVQTNTTITLNNMAVGQEIRVLLQQNSVGGSTAAFTGVNWATGTGAPVLTATANRWDTYLFARRADGTIMGYIGEQNHA